MKGWTTTKEYAAKVGLSPREVRRKCEKGILKAEKIGTVWLVKEKQEAEHD